MRERFGPGDRRFILACLALALVCGAVALRYFGRAFPEASIQFTVNRTESRDVALEFLRQMDLAPAGAKHAATFTFDEEAKTFLERKLGLERAQDLYGKVRLWRWSHRWFIPHEKEEWQVDVTAAGEIASFEHLLPEDAAGAELDPDSARAVAEQFLTQRMRLRLEDYEFLEASSVRQPHRVDHTFTWKKRGLDLGEPDATYRMLLTVAGREPSSYLEYVDIPEAWQDDYARLRAKNDTAARIAVLLLFLTGLAMVGSLVLRIRDHDVRWRTVIGFGTVAFWLQLLATLNQFDAAKFEYLTKDSYASFVTWFLLQALLQALAGSGWIMLLTAAAEPVYRERYPEKTSLNGFFSRRGLRTKRFFKEVLLGLTLMLFFAAYQSVFYLLAAKWGAWAPLEVPYSNMLNTAFPWALVLFIGFLPAVSEEFLSRMFSIPFFDKHFRRLGLPPRVAIVVAIVLASYGWGFAHSDYPNQPFWIRGVEVGTAGIIVSCVMLRWGILATLVWHYTVDAFYTALLMLRSGNTYFVVSGAITAGIMVVPLIVSLILYWKRGGFEPVIGIRNVDEPGPRPAASAATSEATAAPPVSSYTPPPRRRWIVAGGLAVALLLLYFVPVTEPGEGIEFASRREDAVQAARAHMRQLGGDPDRYRVAIQTISRYEPEVGRYVLERAPLERLNELYTDRMRTPVWRVRFYRPEEREEWLFNLPVDSLAQVAEPAIPLWAFDHAIPDSAAGDTLGLEAAQTLAVDFLRVHGIDPDELVPKESSMNRRRARFDYTFEWQVPDSTLGEAGVRYVVIVRGGAVGGLRPYIHLPEAWLRADEERSVLQRILPVLSLGLLVVAALGIVMLFVDQVRKRRFLWGDGLKWGVLSAALAAILAAQRWDSVIMMNYESSMPYQLFLVGVAILIFAILVLAGLTAAVLVGTAFGVRPQARALLRGGHDRRWVRDGILFGLLAVVLLVGADRLHVVLTAFGARYLQIGELFDLPAVARPMPWLDVFADQLLRGILWLPALALAVHMVTRYIGEKRALGLLGIALVLFAAEGARSLPEFGFDLLRGAAVAGLGVFVLSRLLRGNDLAYLVALLVGRGVVAVAPWFSQPAPGAVLTGAIVAVLLAATVALLVALAARRAYGGASMGTSHQASIEPLNPSLTPYDQASHPS